MEGDLINEIDNECHVWSSVKDNELRNIRSTKMRSIFRLIEFCNFGSGFHLERGYESFKVEEYGDTICQRL